MGLHTSRKRACANLTTTFAAVSFALWGCGAGPVATATQDSEGIAADATPVDASAAGDAAADAQGQGGVPSTYVFASRFGAGSSVDYGGQTFRHVLLLDLKTYLGGLTASIDGGKLPKQGEIVQALNFYYKFDGSVGKELPHAVLTDPKAKQALYGELHPGANLQGKIAGNDDPQKQHKDWSTSLLGWKADGAVTPDGLVQKWLQRLEDLALQRAAGKAGKDPSGKDLTKVYVSAEGIDYAELLQKFLTGAISVSQALDDYLDEGLGDDNTVAVSGKPYTALEHAWDEGFGYFGAARDYGLRSDAEVAAQAWSDTDKDGAIDLQREYTFGHAANASKRDAGAAGQVDLSAQVWQALLGGRALIAGAKGPLSSSDKSQLLAWRDQAALAWERAVSATVIHYSNKVQAQMAAAAADYDFYAHAKAWSELKGFALSLQFFPKKQLSDAEFIQLHDWLGDQPVLPAGGQAAVAAHVTALQQARALLVKAYGFDVALAADW
jgi:hypothetical protein